MNKVIGCTGHRLIGSSYSTSTPLYKSLQQQVRDIFDREQPTHCITGMALGFDLLFAEICIELGIPYTAAIPFRGQADRWPLGSQRRYQRALDSAASQTIVCQGGWEKVFPDEPTGPQKMQIRNEWIVDNSDLMIAYFDGSEGGTKNCLDYAISKGKQIHYLTIE